MSFNTSPGRTEYTASAGQTIFPFAFKIYANTDIKVYQTLAGLDPNDITDILILTTDYTVTINGDLGGEITLVSGAAINDAITIVRDLTVSRPIEYQTNGDLLATTLNQDQDYQTYLISDQADRNLLHITLQESTQNVSGTLPAPDATKVIGWNSTASGLQNYTVGASDIFINILNVDSIADLLLVSPTIYSTVNVRGYYAANDGGGGIFNYDATKSAINNGVTIFNGWVRQYSGPIHIKWGGAKADGGTPDSTNIQKVLNLGGAGRSIEFTKEIYLIDATLVPLAGSIIRFNGANLTASASLTTPIIDFNAVTNCNSYDFILNGAYSTSINYLMNMVGSQYNNFYGCHISRCDIGIQIGDDTDTINSENHFFGLTTFDCVRPIMTRGSQTQIFLNGCILVGVNLAQYPGVIPRSISNIGGSIIVNGGAVQTPAATTGSPFYMEPTPYIVTTSTPNSYRYGRISANNSSCETAGALLVTSDAGIVGTIDHGTFQANQCGSFTVNNTLPFIFTDTSFSDLVSVKNCRFVSAAVRTATNMQITNSSVRVDTDKSSWEDNFLDYVDGCVGGSIIYEKDRIVLNASNLTTNTLVDNTYLSLVWSAFTSGTRHQDDFDGTSYVVPVGGFDTLKVDAYIEITEAAPSITSVEMEIVLNTVVLPVRNLSTPSIGGVVYASIQGTLRNLVAGDAIKIRLKTHGAGATGNAASTFRITASN